MGNVGGEMMDVMSAPGGRSKTGGSSLANRMQSKRKEQRIFNISMLPPSTFDGNFGGRISKEAKLDSSFPIR